MRRGEIWWVDLPDPVGRRPVLLVSRDEAYPIRSEVTVAPVTTRIRDIPSHVLLGPEDGMSKACTASCDNLMTIPKKSLLQLAAALTPEKVREVDLAIRFALGLDDAW